MPFPNIDPIAFSIGPIPIRWYALAYIFGVLLAWHYMKRVARQSALWPRGQSPMSGEQIDDYIFWATIGIILGGRLGYILFYNLDYYLSYPAEIFAFASGGMAFHGGFLGVCLATFLFARAKSISLLSLADLVAVASPIGLFLGRIANFINGELYGRPSDVSWAVIFPNGGPEPRHPSQLYEAALEGLLLFIILRIITHSTKALQKPGMVAGIFIIGYGIARSIVELFRMPDEQIGFLSFGSTMGMWLSAPMILAGMGFILYAIRNAKKIRPSKLR